MNDLELAFHLATAASEMALAFFGRVASKLKADNSPVTGADIAVAR